MDETGTDDRATLCRHRSRRVDPGGDRPRDGAVFPGTASAPDSRGTPVAGGPQVQFRPMARASRPNPEATLDVTTDHVGRRRSPSEAGFPSRWPGTAGYRDHRDPSVGPNDRPRVTERPEFLPDHVSGVPTDTSLPDFHPRLKSWGSTVTDRAPTSRGSHLVRDGWVMGRASTAPDRDSGLHLPVLSTNGAYPYLGLGSTTYETNGDSWYGLVGFVPRLNSWASSLSLCNKPRAG
jgi:hypothetical protein